MGYLHDRVCLVILVTQLGYVYGCVPSTALPNFKEIFLLVFSASIVEVLLLHRNLRTKTGTSLYTCAIVSKVSSEMYSPF